MIKRTFCLIIAVICILNYNLIFAAGDIFSGLNTKDYRIDTDILDSYRNVHSRLFFTKEKIEELKIKIDQNGVYKDTYANILAQADAQLQINHPLTANDSNESFHDNWSNGIRALALAYIFSGDKKYLDYTINLIDIACNYRVWGLEADLAASTSLIGMGFAYDWLYDYLPDTTKKLMRTKIEAEGSRIYTRATQENQWYWNREWMQNHMWHTISAMSIAGLAIYDESPIAENWLQTGLSFMSTTASVMGNDGAFHEGINYWFFSFESVFMFLDLARQFYGADILGETEWFSKSASFIISAYLPPEHWTLRNQYYHYADGDEPGFTRDYLLRFLAKEYNDPVAQWLGDEIHKSGFAIDKGRWLNLIWYDETVSSEPPNIENTPLLEHFEDLDFIASRSDWSADQSNYLLRCGPSLGHKSVELSENLPYYDWGAGHVHPDNNHFALWGYGEWLIRDEGYGMPKLTDQHNTLLVNGIGQMGEGGDWLSNKDEYEARAKPKIKKIETNDEYDYIVGDATEAYSKAVTGLLKFERHIIFLRPDIMLVIDDVEANKESRFEVRYWPYSQTLYQQSDGAFFIPGQKADLRILPITNDEVNVSSKDVITRHATPKRNYISISKNNVKKWRNAVALSWSDKKSAPKFITAFEDGDTIDFNIEGQKVSVNPDDYSLTIKKPQIKKDTFNILLNNKNFDIEASLIDGRLFIPPDKLAKEALFDIEYIDGKALIKKGILEIETDIKIINGVPNLPLRFLCESIGIRVRWDDTTKTAFLFYNKLSHSASSKLLGLQIGLDFVKGFSPDVYEYEHVMTETDELPGITMITDDMNSIVKVKPNENPKTGVNIEVTASDFQESSAYKIKYIYRQKVGIGSIPVSGVSASSDNGNLPESTLENNLDTYWASEGNGEWLELDLGETRKIKIVALAFYLGSQRTADFTIQTAGADKEFTEISSFTSSGKTAGPQYFDIPETYCKYVRIVGYGNSESLWNSYSAVGFFDTDEFISEVSVDIDGQPLVGETVNLIIKAKLYNGKEIDLSEEKYYIESDNPQCIKALGGKSIEISDIGVCTLKINLDYKGVEKSITKTIITSDGSQLLSPVADSYTITWRLNDNLGHETRLEVRNALSNPGVYREAFLKFDIGEITKPITKASLFLRVNAATSGSSIPSGIVKAYSVEDTKWTTTSLNAANRPYMIKPLGGFEAISVWKWVEVDVSEFVRKKQIEQSSFVSLGLKAETPELYITVDSSRGPEANRPYIRIYTTD